MDGWRFTSATPEQIMSSRLAEEAGLEGLDFRRADVLAGHLAPTVGLADATITQLTQSNRLADLQAGDIDFQAGAVAFDRTIEKAHPFVDRLAQTGNPAPGAFRR